MWIPVFNENMPFLLHKGVISWVWFVLILPVDLLPLLDICYLFIIKIPRFDAPISTSLLKQMRKLTFYDPVAHNQDLRWLKDHIFFYLLAICSPENLVLRTGSHSCSPNASRWTHFPNVSVSCAACKNLNRDEPHFVGYVSGILQYQGQSLCVGPCNLRRIVIGSH